MEAEKVVLDRDDVRRTLVRIAHEIVEKNPSQQLAIVGIHRRGALLAARLRELVAEIVVTGCWSTLPPWRRSHHFCNSTATKTTLDATKHSTSSNGGNCVVLKTVFNTGT